MPYSPQLNAIELVFSQLKSIVINEFIRNPERRKDLLKVIDESMAKITPENIMNYYKHQAEIVTQCLIGGALSPDKIIYREVDYDMEEEEDEQQQQLDVKAVLEEIKKK